MLLMIPGPIEVSPAVCDAFAGPAPSHVAPAIIEAHGRALELMRDVWCAEAAAQPFIVPGSGTIAMDMAVANLVDAGDAVVIVNTGYFSDRIAEMAVRRGAEVTQVRAPVGEIPTLEAVEVAIREEQPRVVFVTHVDTSTGVRVDPAEICRIARRHDALTVFDGVCAAAGERFLMAEWEADVYLTASQKAIGLPVGIGLMVVSPRAMQARSALEAAPPMSLDWHEWLPIMRAYEERRPSYFSTPASNHIRALPISLAEITADGMEARFQRHEYSAAGMRAAWSAMGLKLLCEPSCAANTLSAVRYPEGIGPELVAAVKSHGVIVAGGLYPGRKSEYFRVGHMGYSATQVEHLAATVRAIARGIKDVGGSAREDDALAAFYESAQFPE